MLRPRIDFDTVTIGSWITIGDPTVAEIMARAGFDWLVVDLEHSVIGIDRAGELIRIIDLCGVAPLVRLTSNSPDQIKRVMDAGADGIIVPMVNSPDEAARAVACTRYAPRGRRGVGLARAQGYGTRFEEYVDWQSDGPVVIAQIEHKDAISRLHEILAVPGIDAFIIGPYDLSGSLEIPGDFENPAFQAAVKTILETGQRLGRPAGIHIVEPDFESVEQSIREGYTFIAYSVDARMLDVSVRTALARAKAVVR